MRNKQAPAQHETKLILRVMLCCDELFTYNYAASQANNYLGMTSFYYVKTSGF